MKKTLSTIGALALFASVALAQATMTKTAPTPKPVKTAAAKTMTPKADPEIQKCTEDKLAGSKLKADGLTVAVSGGVATLTGATKVAGHKGNATQFAKRCGATSVTNNITVEKAMKAVPKKA